MNKKLTRRQFVSSSTIAATGLTLAKPTAGFAVPVPTDSRLVRLGLNALARAPEMKYFADGHRGAALISAHLM